MRSEPAGPGPLHRVGTAIAIASTVILVILAIVVALVITRHAQTGNGISPVTPTTWGDPSATASSPVDTPSRTMTLPSTTLYIAGSAYVWRITTDGKVSTIAGNGERKNTAPIPGPASACPMQPVAVAVDHSGTIYIADKAGYVEKVTPDGKLSIIAGNGDTKGSPAPGPALNSPIAKPSGIAVDAAGNVYVADARSILKVTPDGMLSVVAGLGPDYPGHPVPGPATASALEPGGLAVDAAGNLYATDANQYVVKVSPDGLLSVIAGGGASTGANNPPPAAGPALDAHLRPIGVAVDRHGNVFIADFNGYIEKVTPDGILSIIAGKGHATGVHPPVPGPATESPMDPLGIAVDDAGNVYTADLSGFIGQVTAAGVLSIVAGDYLSGVPGPVTWPTPNDVMGIGGVAV